jgi:predicted nucleotide-binding protein
MTIPLPPLGQCHQVIETIWGMAQETLSWPTFVELDRRIDRLFEIDLLEVLKEMPPGFLYGVSPNNPVPPSDSQEIGLTVAGIAACDNTAVILSAFFGLIKLAARTEKQWEPSSGNPKASPVLSDVDFESHSPEFAGTHQIMPLLYLMLGTEQMGWAGLSLTNDGHWAISITREIRRFRNMVDINDYWSRRHKPWESKPPYAYSFTEGIPVTASARASENSNTYSVASDIGISHNAPIFIVHGSDTLRAESVAHTVSTATGRKTIILREEANLGQTLIEKFEKHAAEVSYAIIILTPDDKGSRAGDTDSRPRGRQNVIFEMGYFYGLIGRAKVSVLLYPGVEKPSDMDGIAYITFDDNRAWKTELLRELRHAGFDINF